MNKVHLIKQLIRYGIVGGTAFCTQYLVVILLVHFFKLNPLTANIFGFGCGFIVSFTGHRLWTFQKHTRQTHKLFLHYSLLSLINLALNQTLYFIFLHKLHFHYATALPIVIALATSIVFCINKLWVFRA